MRGPVLLGAAALAALALSTPASAKPESAGQTVKRIVKKTKKLKSYRVSATIKGGTAQGKDHRLIKPTVNQSFTCTVKGKVAGINGGKAYRFRLRGADGAIQSGSAWKKMLATKEGRLIQRLFLRPEEHLINAFKYRKKAKWLPSTVKKSGAVKGTGLFGDDDKVKTESDPGTTKVRKKKKARKSRAKQPAPSNRILVKAPSKVALQHFTTIINSGCFSAG